MYTIALAAALLLQADDPLQLEVTQLAPHDRPIVALGAGPKEEALITMTDDGTIHRYLIDEGEFSWSKETISNKTFPPANPWDNEYYFAIGEDVAALAFEMAATCEARALENGESLPTIATMSAMEGTGAIAVDPQDRWVWIGTRRGTLTRVLVDSLNGWSNRAAGNGGVTALSIDRKGKELAIGGKDGTLRFAGNKSANVDKKAIFDGHSGPVTALCWSPDGKSVASGDGNGLILLRSRRGGRERLKWTLEGVEILAFAFHPKGKWLAVRGSEGSITIWNPKSGDKLAVGSVDGKTNGNHSLLVLGKGKRLIAAGAGAKLASFDLDALD